jgi:hypothetical protein
MVFVKDLEKVEKEKEKEKYIRVLFFMLSSAAD